MFIPSIFQSSTKCDTPPTPPPLPPTTDESTTSSTPPPPTPDDSIATIAASVSSCPNPGPLESATWDTRRLTTLDTFDGVRIDISKQLSPYFSCVHSFHLGTSMLPDGRTSSYSFTTQMNDEEGYSMARVDPERQTVDGRIGRALLGGVAMAKLNLNLSNDGSGNDQMLGEVDLGAQTWTANLKYGSMGGGNVYGCNYFQSVTPQFAMGGEGMYVGVNGNMLSSYTGKYSFYKANHSEDEKIGDSSLGGGNPTGAGGGTELPCYLAATYNAGQGMLSLAYKQSITSQRVTVGASLECSPATLDSQVVVGAEFNLTRSKMNVCVDGTGRIQSVLEAKLGREPGSPALNFAAEVDHGKGLMRFGYGLNIGS